MKPVVNLIAAVGRSGQLGLNGRLPWYDPRDLQWFKEMTWGGIVVVGSVTARSLPPLLGRSLLVQTRHDHPEALLCRLSPHASLWIAGGAKTYERWMPYVDRFYIGRVDYDGPADAWMPALPFGR